MEDSFRVRVDKTFGSLPSSSSTAPSSSLSSLWSLTDDEIERNEWNRDKDSTEEPETDSFPFRKGFLAGNTEKSDVDFRLELEKDLDDLDDDLDDEQSSGSRATSSLSVKQKPDDYNDEEWEIKNSIGMDCTLDNEEEEDEYDKVAVGKEKKADDRLYMKGVADYGIETNTDYELPDSFEEIPRDPRANHITAKLRLKEDAEAAKKMDSLRVSEHDSAASIDDQVKSSDDGNLKSILKRRDDESDSKSKDNQSDSKSQKRVRFDPECKDGSDEGGDANMETDFSDKSFEYPLPPDYPSGIPDYMRNPSKYTRYTFDSGEVDEQSNRQAYMDFLKMIRKSDIAEPQPDDASGDLPKSVTFIPKRKVSDSVMKDDLTESNQNQDDASKGSLQRKGVFVGITAADTEESELCAMEEDEPGRVADKRNSSQRPGRKYRTKPRLESDESS